MSAAHLASDLSEEEAGLTLHTNARVRTQVANCSLNAASQILVLKDFHPPQLNVKRQIINTKQL